MKIVVNYLNFDVDIEEKTKSNHKLLNFVFQFIKNTKCHLGTPIAVVYYTFIKLAEVIINKKLSMGNIFKKIVESNFQELEEKISQEINDNLKLVVTSTLDVVKKKNSNH